MIQIDPDETVQRKLRPIARKHKLHEKHTRGRIYELAAVYAAEHSKEFAAFVDSTMAEIAREAADRAAARDSYHVRSPVQCVMCHSRSLYASEALAELAEWRKLDGRWHCRYCSLNHEAL